MFNTGGQSPSVRREFRLELDGRHQHLLARCQYVLRVRSGLNCQRPCPPRTKRGMATRKEMTITVTWGGKSCPICPTVMRSENKLCYDGITCPPGYNCHASLHEVATRSRRARTLWPAASHFRSTIEQDIGAMFTKPLKKIQLTIFPRVLFLRILSWEIADIPSQTGERQSNSCSCVQVPAQA